MALIEADLTSVNRDGLLKANRALLHDTEGQPTMLLLGDRVTVRDLFGSEEFDSRVVAIVNDDVLLEVDWDDEPAPYIAHASLGARHGLVSFGGVVFIESHLSSPYVSVHEDVNDDVEHLV